MTNLPVPADSDKPLASPKGSIVFGLRERNEEDLARAGRAEMEVVLREEWEYRDKVGGEIQMYHRSMSTPGCDAC